MSWARVKKASLDHIKENQESEPAGENGQAEGGQVDNATENGAAADDKKMSVASVSSETSEGGAEKKASIDDGSARKKSSAWAKTSKKITPLARLSTKTSLASRKDSTTSDEKWAAEQKLKANYYIDDGVSKWHLIYPLAAQGKRQSPIDIETGRILPDPGLKPLLIDYDKQCCKSVVNTGNSFKVDVDDKVATLFGGALGNEYRLIQFHAHWGTTAGAKGSEHTVNGRLYPAELHLVHWNTKYGLFSRAVSEPDGLAVVGIFMEIGEEDHPEMEKITKTFSKIQYKNMRCEFDEEIDPAKLLPADLSYWHYQGSLTTPPLDESVMWHLLREPIHISKKQLSAMAGLRTGTDKRDDFTCIINNFRPPAPLFGREVALYTGEGIAAANSAGRQDKADKDSSRLAEDVNELKKMVGQLAESVQEMKTSLKIQSRP